ncbi:MAG: HNH endonuclease [Defluviitaleaceae bacterium]|nr:HNH endonuclease [Defluviitaleaceae bacterium]MCL2240717.1 HNH endonuclease [Defluviitaleaceae bacterium]
MVRLFKSPPPKVEIKSPKDYRQGEVFDTLKNDCHEKCYICEDKPIYPNVEHLVAHRGNPALQYDWNNLLLACGHCNNIKGDRFDDMLNPIQCDPEEHIALSIKITDDITDYVLIKPLNENKATAKTAELLGLVYNGGSTDMKELGSSNLRNEHLIPDIRRFYQYIRNHREEPDLGYDDDIRKEINCCAKFAAFKRKIIKDDPALHLQFSKALV